MKTLDLKVWRELRALRFQSITIAVVVAAGVALFTGSQSSYVSLQRARDRFYADSALARGFAAFKRAPDSVREQVASIPGVSAVNTRIINEALLHFPHEPLPVAALIVSLTPDFHRPFLRQGTAPMADDEVLLSEAFARANHLRPGDPLEAVINGRLRSLTVSGIALSPEFVYIFRPSNPLPDDKHYGVMFMTRAGMENAFDMAGAANSLLFTFAPGAARRAVLAAVDEILEPWGGLGAHDRDRLASHSLLNDEFRQLRTSATLLPLVFLGVAAFLLNIVASRIIAREREQIATLKALGYSDRAIIAHYLKLVGIISLGGALFGMVLGVRLGFAMNALYAEYYHFPHMDFVADWRVFLFALAAGLGSGLVGALFPARGILRLNPAQAMHPPVPPVFGHSPVGALERKLGIRGRMLLRNLLHKPGRALLTVGGISMSVMIMVLGMFSGDSVDFMLSRHFEILQRDSVAAVFQSPVPAAVENLFAAPGTAVIAEGYRQIPVRLRAGRRQKEIVLQGVPAGARLRRLVSETGQAVEAPTEGICVNSKVAGKLGIRPGQALEMEILEGNRRRVVVTVAGLIDEVLGQGVYMERTAMHRLLNEDDSVNILALHVPAEREAATLAALRQIPRVSGIATRSATLRLFRELMQRSALGMAVFVLAFAAAIAIGVVYNTAMIVLAERAFELGSLRILGFTPRQVFAVVAGELGCLILAALPLGCLAGYGLAWLMMNTVETEGFNLPVTISRSTYGVALITTLVTAAFSFLLIRVKINRLDLVAILKIRE